MWTVYCLGSSYCGSNELILWRGQASTVRGSVLLYFRSIRHQIFSLLVRLFWVSGWRRRLACVSNFLRRLLLLSWITFWSVGVRSCGLYHTMACHLLLEEFLIEHVEWCNPMYKEGYFHFIIVKVTIPETWDKPLVSQVERCDRKSLRLKRS